jgi:hypothetical protein
MYVVVKSGMMIATISKKSWGDRTVLMVVLARVKENMGLMGTIMTVYLIWERYRRVVAKWHIVEVGVTMKFDFGVLR